MKLRPQRSARQNKWRRIGIASLIVFGGIVSLSGYVATTHSTPAFLARLLPTVHNAFAVDEPAPVINSMDPSYTGPPTDGSPQTVVILGQDFVDGIQAYFGGEALETTFVSSGEISVLVTDPNPESDREVEVMVTNPDGQSSTFPGLFYYVAYNPVFSGITGPTHFFIDGNDAHVDVYGQNLTQASVTVSLPGATYEVVGDGLIRLTLPSAGLTQTTGVSITVTNQYGRTSTFSNIVTFDPIVPPSISSVDIQEGMSPKQLVIHGSHFPSYGYGTSRSLVKLNGVNLPFCTTNIGVTAAYYQQNGIAPALVSDTPTCYLFVGADHSLVFTDTQVIVLVSDGFDVTAAGTVSVDGGNVFTFNESQSGGGGNNENTNPPSTSTPGTQPQTPSGSAPDMGTPPVKEPENNTPIPGDQALPTEQVTDDNTTLTIVSDGKTIMDDQLIKSKPTFSGIAAPFSTVTVTVHSDPVVCTTKADAAGKWTCTLPSELPDGDHTVRVSVATPDGKTTELGPYQVTVKADTPTTVKGSVEPSAAQGPSLPVVIASIVGAVVIATIIGLIVRARRTS